jgi:peptidoglycan DL-endopeptidase CwlO
MLPPWGIKGRIRPQVWLVVPGVPASRVLRALCSAVLGVALAGLPSVAWANPSPHDLSRQLDAASQQLETVVEQYNSTQVRLAGTQAQRDALLARMAPVERAMAALEDQVGRYSAGLYEHAGGSISALIAAGSPDDLLDQLTMLDHVSSVAHRQIEALSSERRAYEAQRRDLDTVLAQQQAQQADLAAKKTRIEAQITSLSQLRYMLYGGRRPVTMRDRYVPPYQPGPAGVAVRFAYGQLGKPYRWGAAGPNSFDCSGLTMASWKAAGVGLPHSAALQWAQVRHVPRAELKPGDLVFYYGNIHHVAIYIGDGRVIHAPTYGEDVTIAPIDDAPLHGYGRP